MPPSTKDDVRSRLHVLAQQNPEWQLWLTLVGETLRAADGPAWIAAVPQPHSHRPPAAPLLAGVTLAVNTRQVSHWVRRLVKRAVKDKKSATAVLTGISFNHIDILALLRAAICQDHTHIKALAEVVGADSRVLGTVAELAAMPLLQMCGQHLPDQVPSIWPFGYCPICGAWAILAEVRGLDRTRRLRCARCGGDWQATWLRCPYCGETDHQRLGFLAPHDSSETRRVETCESCKGYIKLITTLQATPPYAVALEDLATVDLDIAALQRGYARPGRPGYVLGVCLVDSPMRMRTFFARRR